MSCHIAHLCLSPLIPLCLVFIAYLSFSMLKLILGRSSPLLRSLPFCPTFRNVCCDLCLYDLGWKRTVVCNRGNFGQRNDLRLKPFPFVESLNPVFMHFLVITSVRVGLVEGRCVGKSKLLGLVSETLIVVLD